jgi:hypothetical protein
MICEKCGYESEPKAGKDPWCMYKFENGVVINKLFDPDAIPKGWYDSPRAAKEGVKKTSKQPKEAIQGLKL